MKLHPAVISMFAGAFILLNSCSKEKTQRELYNEAVSSFTYKTYKVASKTAMPPAVMAYNHELPDSVTPLENEYAHLFLGFGWTTSSKTTMAFAEADIADESEHAEVKFLAGTLRSIAMYMAGWDSLAKEESDRAKAQVPDSSASEVQTEATVFYLLMGLAKCHERDFAGSKIYFAGFGTETGIHWPYKVVDAAADLHSGRVQEGLGKLKVLSQDPNVPASLRQALAERITLIESKTGDVNSRLFWPKLISAVVIEEMKRSNNEQLNKLVGMMESVREKLPV